MGRVLVEDHDLEEIRFGRKIGFNGKEGSCYFSEDDNQVIKLYHIFLGTRKVYFDGLVSNSISFPNDILIYKYTEAIAGYTMDYFPGIQLYNGFPKSLELNNLKKAYQDLKRVVETYKDINMYDLCVANILFDFQRAKFNLIDTSRWYPCFNSNNSNLDELHKTLAYIICHGNLAWLNEYMNKSKELFELYKYYKLGQAVPFLELLEAISKEVNEKFEICPITIEDLIPKMYKKS